MNRGLSSKFWWLNNATIKICWRMWNVYKLACFTQKIFTNWLNTALPLRAWLSKRVYKEKNTVFLVKKNSGRSDQKRLYQQFSGTGKDPSLVIYLKTCKLLTVLPIANSLCNVHIIWMTLVYALAYKYGCVWE